MYKYIHGKIRSTLAKKTRILIPSDPGLKFYIVNVHFCPNLTRVYGKNLKFYWLIANIFSAKRLTSRVCEIFINRTVTVLRDSTLILSYMFYYKPKLVLNQICFDFLSSKLAFTR